MNARDLIQRYTLDVQDLPNQTGMNVVTIAGLEVETFTPKGGGPQVPQTRKKLHFRELSLPLGLNNTRLEILINMLGEETDSWRGRKIGLFIGATTSFGVTKKTVFVHLTPMDAAPGSGPPQLNAAAVTNPDGPIGEANAKRFSSALAEQGASFEDFLHWLKRNDRPAHDTTIGLDLPDLKRALTPLMHRFLREYQNPPAPTATPVEKPRELVEQAPAAAPAINLNTTGKPAAPRQVDEADDIPF